ncbi:MAG: phosphopantetheine-binding protein [Acutalibacteraceae bacterium]
MIEKLKEIFARYSDADISGITQDTVILRDLGLNSYAIIEIINEIEEEFDIEIPDNILPDIKTVGDMLRFLEKAKSN